MAQPLDALVVSDLHYVREAVHECPLPWRRTALALDLLERAFLCLCKEGVEVGLAILLGDVVDNGGASGADRDLAAVAGVMRSWQVPILAVPGNHDGDEGRFARTFDCAPGLHEVGGYGFLVFHDRLGEGDVTTRPQAGLALPAEVAAAHPGLPLVALQHNPLHPAIADAYPYMLTNGDAVLGSYREAGVVLSVSGHYHPGQVAHRVGYVTYYTVPALCEEPFRFAHLRLMDRTVEVREQALIGDHTESDSSRHYERGHVATT